MPTTEPKTHSKSDGTEGAMSIEIDLDSANVGEPTIEEAAAATPETAAPPASLELAAPAAATERPAWLDPRFKTPEDMAASYRELESKLGQPAPAKPAEAPAKPAEAPQTGLTDAELQAYAREVNSTGRLSDASYAALQAKGLPKALVDAHVEGLQARKAQLLERAVKPFGGTEGYQEAATWAVSNLTPEAQAQYNADVNSGDPARVQYAVENLKARYDAANGRQPSRLIGGRRPSAAGSPGFKSMDEQVAAMQDPRYGTNPAYTAEVRRMVENSSGY